MNLHPIKTTLLILIMMLSFTGCINEDLSTCGGLTVKFRYTLNPSGEDLFTSQVHDGRLYIFGSDGVLCDIVRISSENLKAGSMPLKLQTGSYDIVAWASSGNELMGNQYLDAQMIDASTDHYLTPAVVGQTTIDDFYLMLCNRTNTKAEDGDGDGEGEGTPLTKNPDDLFHGTLLHLDYHYGERRTETIDFIKNSHKLKVRVNGLNYLHVTSAAAYVLARNERYRFDNAIGDYPRMLRYEPEHPQMTDGNLSADIKLLRLDKEYHTTTPIILKIKNSDTGEDVFDPIDVMDALLQVKDTNGNYLYRTQEDLDRQDEYLIEINISADLDVSISVNSWVIGTLTPGVQ